MSSIERAMEELKQEGVSGQRKLDNEAMDKKATIAGSYPDRNITKKCSFQAMLKHGGFLLPDMKDTVQLDEYRQIKRPLLINAFGKCAVREERANLVMITSSVAGEGKTYTTINLALSMAMERDTTVLIIDGDNIRASLTRSLGLDGSIGLIELLTDENFSVEDTIVKTDIPKLSVIPSGRVNAFSTELYASEKMQHLLKELAERYNDRIILFDSPPLLQTSQTKVLSHHAGQIMLVVEEGKTPLKAVVEAVGLLDHKKIIGTIINKRRYRSSGDYYGGYYGVPDKDQGKAS